jgi:hypothetical protein
MPTRRSALIALILVIVVMIILLVLATRASAPRSPKRRPPRPPGRRSTRGLLDRHPALTTSTPASALPTFALAARSGIKCDHAG